MLRTGPHATLEELDRHAGVPVVNGLTYAHHPCQALADAQTIRERFGTLSELPVAYLGDGNNCCASLMIVGALTGMRVTAGCPPGYRPDPEIVEWADAAARERGGWARVVDGPPRGGRRGAGALHRHLGVDGRRGEPRPSGSPRWSPTGLTTR